MQKFYVPDLTQYDWIVINTSAGKDSVVMLDKVVSMARAQGVLPRVVAVHCDLGRVEWKGTRELAERQAQRYGVRFEIVKRPQGDLLDHVLQRGMFPGMTNTRFCTSDHKRGQVDKLFTALSAEFHNTCNFRDCGRPRFPTRAFCAKHSTAGGYAKHSRKCRILNCMGMRKDESKPRSKLERFKHNARASNKTKRHVDDWLPIFHVTEREVFEIAERKGLEMHPAYALGMPRLSCCFCIYGNRDAFLLAGEHNPDLLDDYCAVEEATGHNLTAEISLRDIREQLRAGVRATKVSAFSEY